MEPTILGQSLIVGEDAVLRPKRSLWFMPKCWKRKSLGADFYIVAGVQDRLRLSPNGGSIKVTETLVVGAFVRRIVLVPVF